jgi:hypothetical protein
MYAGTYTDFIPRPLIENLKKFTYSGGGCVVSDSSDYNPKKVIRELVKYAAHSLEELVMYQGDLGEDVSAPPTTYRHLLNMTLIDMQCVLVKR